MKVFVVEGSICYEGSDVLGVYLTEELAKQAKEKYKVTHELYDFFEIYEFEVIDTLENK